MHWYVDTLCQQFRHNFQSRPQHSPYKAPRKGYGATTQDTIPPDETEKLDKKKVKIIQQVIWVCLYYGRVVGNTILPALSAPTSKRAQSTLITMEKII
jgi:hypothetical protein